MMNCRRCRKLASAYLDRQLAPPEHRDVLQHLSRCPSCRAYLGELEHISRRLGALPSVTPPATLAADTVAAFVRLRQRPSMGILTALANWAMSHARPVSAVASFLITAVCYGAILGQMKPIPSIPLSVRAPTITVSASQYRWINGLSSSSLDASSYTFPRIRRAPSSDASLAEVKTTPIVVIAMIHADGRASLVQLVEPAGTPQLMEHVRTALSALQFRPAMAGGHPVPTRLILLVDRMDVRG